MKGFASDSDKWRWLLAAARAVLEKDTTANRQALWRSANRARTAVMPEGHRYPGSIFSRLISAAAATGAGPENDAELRQLVDACEAVLNSGPRPPAVGAAIPAPPETDDGEPRGFAVRKDLFG